MSTLNATNLKNPSSGSNNIVLGTDGATTLGTTKVTAITDSAGSNSSTPAAIANGTAKAWVNFNGTGTVAIRASYNVSSITDDGVGQYTVNFTTAFTDANYSIVSMSESETQGTTNRSATVFSLREGTTPTTSACSFVCKQGSFSTSTSLDIDKSFMNVAIFR